jgi:hypothetical protein
MKCRRSLVDFALITLVTAIIAVTLPTVARGDTVEPTLLGTAALTVGEFVLIVVCVLVLIAVGIYLLTRIRRRREREAPDESGTGSEDRSQ